MATKEITAIGRAEAAEAAWKPTASKTLVIEQKKEYIIFDLAKGISISQVLTDSSQFFRHEMK